MILHEKMQEMYIDWWTLKPLGLGYYTPATIIKLRVGNKALTTFRWRVKGKRMHRHAVGMTRRPIMGCIILYIGSFTCFAKAAYGGWNKSLLPLCTYALLTRESTYKPASDCVYAATAVDVQFWRNPISVLTKLSSVVLVTRQP